MSEEEQALGSAMRKLIVTMPALPAKPAWDHVTLLPTEAEALWNHVHSMRCKIQQYRDIVRSLTRFVQETEQGTIA